MKDIASIAEARERKEFIKRLIEAANKANALRFSRWQAIANRSKRQ
jgi:hypothetical protein